MLLVLITLLIFLLSRSPAIVVATPGRLWDLVQEGNPHLSLLSQLRYLAIDETDRTVEKVQLRLSCYELLSLHFLFMLGCSCTF